MRHGSLFSGIGGFDLAAEWMGWENIFHCEWNLFGQKILKHYWPNSIQYHDITKTDFSIHRGNIDIITGGFPCQPYSSAGKRLGKDDERHLWPEMLRAIKEIEPTWIVGENVRGLTNWNGGMVFNEVQADLENCGYEVQPILLPACAVNAPHRRDRIWFVAYSNSIRLEQRENRREVDSRQGKMGAKGDKFTNDIETNGEISNATNASNKGLQGESNEREDRREESQGSSYRRRNFTGVFCSKWEEFPTESPLCGRNDGISPKLDGITFSKWRQESIKGYGNAVVPQLVYQIFKTIEEFEQLITNNNK